MTTDEEFYTIKGFVPDKITISHKWSDCPTDGSCFGEGEWHFVDITDPVVIAEMMAEDERKQAEHVAAKGHDCWDFPVHRTFRRQGGGTQDAYDCGVCGDLLQVG
jgi:hypothetical protein